jgi:hypothetical protein
MSAGKSSPPYDLYDLARLNGNSLLQRYERKRLENPKVAKIVERFCQRVEHDGHVSINTKSTRLISMLRKGYYPNPHDEARERAELEGGDSEAYLKEQQGAYYTKRTTFERSFRDGERFRYAALNIAGAGLSYYGLYCLIVRAPTEGDRIALLPANSLKRFMLNEHQLNIEKLKAEIAPWPNRHHLTACKHSDEVVQTAESEWPTMMCHASEATENFIEIIVGSAVRPEDLIEIRGDKVRLGELMEKLIKDYALSAFERAEIEMREAVFKELQSHGLDALYREVLKCLRC